MAELAAKDAAGFETGNWFLDTILKPGSSMSSGTLSFLDKVFYLLFACIVFLMCVHLQSSLSTFLKFVDVHDWQVDARFSRYTHICVLISSHRSVPLGQVLCE